MLTLADAGGWIAPRSRRRSQAHQQQDVARVEQVRADAADAADAEIPNLLPGGRGRKAEG